MLARLRVALARRLVHGLGWRVVGVPAPQVIRHRPNDWDVLAASVEARRVALNAAISPVRAKELVRTREAVRASFPVVPYIRDVALL